MNTMIDMAVVRYGVLLSVAALPACGEGPIEQEAEVSSVRDTIINGTVPTPGSLQDRGVVQLSSGCTGTLLSNQHVLTARHCVTTWNVATSSWGAAIANIAATLEGPGGNQVVLASRVMEPTTATLEPDYALIELASPMLVGGRSADHFNPIYGETDASLDGDAVVCIGYGNNALATTTSIQAGGGVLRTANLNVTSTGAGMMVVGPGGGQVPTSGDSGSTCFRGAEVTGVLSTIDGVGSDIDRDGVVASWEFSIASQANYVSPDTYRDFVESRILANVAIAFDYLPALPVGSMPTAVVASLNDSQSIDLRSGVTLPAFALRAGSLDVRVEEEPPDMFCTHTNTTTPLDGTPTVQGTCMTDGLVTVL